MKTDKKISQKIHDYWYVEPEKVDKSKYFLNGEFCEIVFKINQDSENERAKDQQRENRLKVYALIFGVVFGILLYLYFFQAILCLGLFVGVVGMLIKLK